MPSAIEHPAPDDAGGVDRWHSDFEQIALAAPMNRLCNSRWTLVGRSAVFRAAPPVVVVHCAGVVSRLDRFGEVLLRSWQIVRPPGHGRARTVSGAYRAFPCQA